MSRKGKILNIVAVLLFVLSMPGLIEAHHVAAKVIYAIAICVSGVLVVRARRERATH
jgi:hypothetical protein